MCPDCVYGGILITRGEDKRDKYHWLEFCYRCLNPGKYAQHLERWLSYYPPQQLHIIDGEQLRQNPVETLHELQRFLKITPAFNYSSHLRYDPKKGFFCQVTNEDRTKCLGKSKGRQYPPMEDKSYKLLQVRYSEGGRRRGKRNVQKDDLSNIMLVVCSQRYYLSHNTALVKLLKRLGLRTIPQWLKEDLTDTVMT